MKILLIFVLFIILVESKIHIFDSKVTEVPVQKGTRVYFLTSGNENDLKEITVKAEKSKIDTNVFAYSVPQMDGSLNPLSITSDDNDTLVITRPDGNTVQVTMYANRITENLNVFPIFEKSSIQFKNGKNVFFAVDRPNGKILTIKNLKIDQQNNGFLRIYSGVPGDLIPPPYLFFNSEIYKTVNFYQQLDIPIYEFSMDPVFSGVSYTISFGEATSMLQSAGLIMTPDYPITLQPSDFIYKVNRNGEEHISLHMNPFFYKDHSYNTDIIVNFGFGVEQGSSFPSELDGTMNIAGTINSVEVRSFGAFAIQYYTNSTSTDLSGNTISLSQETTTKSSRLLKTGLSLFTVIFSLFIK